VIEYAVVLLVLAAIAWILWRVSAKTGYPGALSLGFYLPLMNVVTLLVLAFAEWPIERKLKRFQYAYGLMIEPHLRGLSTEELKRMVDDEYPERWPDSAYTIAERLLADRGAGPEVEVEGLTSLDEPDLERVPVASYSNLALANPAIDLLDEAGIEVVVVAESDDAQLEGDTAGAGLLTLLVQPADLEAAKALLRTDDSERPVFRDEPDAEE
jgi:hypothetical protein